MKHHPLVLVVFLLAITAGLDARTGTIILKDGSRWTGDISSLSDSLEWRRDLASSGNQTIIIKPERKGRTKLQDIREIRRITASEAPEEGVELEDGRTARLLLQYRIILNSGRILTISDFVTLENFYLDVASTAGGEHRVYLSSISSLVFGPAQAQSASRPSSKPVSKPVSKSIPKSIPAAQPLSLQPLPQPAEPIIAPSAEATAGISSGPRLDQILIWILGGLCVVFGTAVIFLVVRRQKKRTVGKKHHKTVRSRSRRR
jgi:hypothetical protein